MATLQVTNLQNAAAGAVNLSLNADGTSTITLFTSSTPPTGFRTGTLWYDVTGAGLKVYNGTAWSDVSGGGGSGVASFSAGTTGLTPVTATTGAVTLAGTLAVANGGTGSTTVAGARTSLLPSQAGQNGKVLGTNGTDVSWVTVSGTGTVTSVNVVGGTTGLTTTGGPITAAGDITLDGTLAVAHGGTGGVTPTAALTNLLPSQTGNAGKFLHTDGTTTSWVAESGSGTVTSVNVVGGTTGLTTTGGPITAAGDLTLSGTLAVSHGGTGSTTAAAARTALLPSQTGESGKVLSTNGTDVLWVADSGSGVEEVAAGSNISVAGGTTATATVSVVSAPTFSGLLTARQITITGPGQNSGANGALIVEGGGIESRPGGSAAEPGFILNAFATPFFGGMFLNVSNRQVGFSTTDGAAAFLSPSANEFVERIYVNAGGSAATPALAVGGQNNGMYLGTDGAFNGSIVGLSVGGNAHLVVGKPSGYGAGDLAIKVASCASSSSGGTPIHADGNNVFYKFSSSIRTKQNVIDVPDAWGLKFVRDTRSVQYEPNRGETVEGQDGPPKCFGYIAEELAEDYPELVIWEDGVISGVRYMHFHGIHHKAIKELDAKVSDLEEENTYLLSTVASLLARVEALENA
jgi:hypothetical protein